jgi:hypothetical protein
MPTLHQPLFRDAFLASRWASDFAQFRGSPSEIELIRRLHDWVTKQPQKESAAEDAFVDIFFEQT